MECNTKPIKFHGEVVQDYKGHKHYKADPKDLIGKTITGFECSAVNVWSLRFSDGTAVTIDSEVGALGIPCMTLCNACLEAEDE